MFLVYTHVVREPINDKVPYELRCINSKKTFSDARLLHIQLQRTIIKGDMHNDCPFEEMYMTD